MLTDVFYRRAIIAVSIAVPVLVTILAYVNPPHIDLGFDLKIFPQFHAFLNSLATIFLVGGYFAIINKNIKVHRRFMWSAFTVSCIFLVSYVTYHALSAPTKYGGEGALKYIYYFVLLTHIVMAAVILPIILFTFYRALTGDYVKHKKIARITLPLWLYVTTTGVLVYFMIAPYY
jgi:putative membrane protein